jgi:aryl-alcohol dehydrogenase-like predicted oxidoreductase
MKRKFNSKIVVGTWSLSGDFGKVSKKNIYKSIEKSIDSNFLEFDTSPTYGEGKMHKILADMLRHEKEIKINTKCGYNSNFLKTFNPKDIISSIDLSLSAFGKINTLFLHNPRNEIKDWYKIIKILKEYKKKNYIKKIGISLARDFYFEKQIMNQFDYLQDEINLLRPNSINFLNSFTPKIMARSPLASGCLSGKLKKESRFEKSDYRFGWLSNKDRLKNILFQVNEISKVTGKNIRKFSKIFLLQNTKIDKVIFGIKSPSHVDELVKDIHNQNFISTIKVKKIFQLADLNFNLNPNRSGY